MRINTATRELVCKVVYYGPGMSGKTTNLHYVHTHAPSKVVSELVNIDTESERTIQFDLLPVDIGKVDGFDCRFEFYTVPGQSYYAATRRLVLEGADGIVFVADSRREAIDENIDSMNDMNENIRHHNLSPDIPVIIQYNKQDIESALPPEQLNPLLNSQQHDTVSAVANQGVGVIECMKLIMEKIVKKVREGDALKNNNAIQQKQPTQDSHLVTCCHCQTMLDIKGARVGDAFTCGSCQKVFRIKNLDHGTTEPSQGTGSVSRHQSGPASSDGPQPPQPGEESGYAMHSLPNSGSQVGAGSSALNLAADPTGTNTIIGNGPSLPGFETLKILDSSLLGSRIRARHESSGQIARALVLNPALMQRPRFYEQLQTQIQLVAQVRHPNILPITSVQELAGQTVTFSPPATDYRTLAAILSKHRTLPPPQAVGIVKQIALGLEEAARHGIVHGFLRPESVLVDADGKVLVDDIAIPKDYGFLVRESMGGSAATEYAFAPEHLADDARSDVRTDIFLIGSLFFRMISGEGLLTGYSAHEALHRLNANGAKSLRDVNPDISRELDAFVRRLTAVDRSERLQSYSELLKDFEAFGGGARRHSLNLHQTRPTHRPRTAAVRRTVAHGAGTGSATRRTLAGEDSAIHGSRIHRRKKESRAPLVIAVILVVAMLVAAIVLIIPNLQSTPTYSPPVDRTPDEQVTTPARTPDQQTDTNQPTPAPQPAPTPAPEEPAVETPTTQLAQAQALLEQYQQNPADDEIRAQAMRLITPLMRSNDAEISRQANALRNGFMAAKEAATLGQDTTTQQAAAPDDNTQTAQPETPPDLSQSTQPALTSGQRIHINELILQERFGEARQLVMQLIEDPPQQQPLLDTIAERHGNKREAVQLAVMRASTTNEVDAILKKPREVWQMPGDKEWAASLERARSNLPEGEAPATVTTPTTTQGGDDVSNAPSSLGGFDRTALRKHALVIETLQRRNPDEAMRVIGTLDEEATKTLFQRHVNIWNSASEVMPAAFAARNIKHRVRTPYGTELWDVAGIDDKGLVLRAPGGSESGLGWGQVKPADLAALYNAIADHPDAQPVEHAVASVYSMHAGSLGAANVQLNHAREANYPFSRDLQLLLDMRRLVPAEKALMQGQDAIASHDLNSLKQAITELEGHENIADAIAPAVAYLQAAATAISGGKSFSSGSSTTTVTPNVLTFDDRSDLDRLQSEGSWSVAGGMLTSGKAPSRLSAEGLQQATAANVLLTPRQQSGSVIISFRGVQLHIDLASQKYVLRSNARESTPTGYPFLANISYDFYFAIQGDGTARVEINNKESLVIPTGRLTNRFDLITRPDTDIAIDEIRFKRSSVAVAQPGQNGQQGQSLIRDVLGWEPFGQARLVDGRIELPAIAGAATSGIALPLKEDTLGTRFTATGTGTLGVYLGDLASGDKDGGVVQLPANGPVEVTVKRDGKDLVITTGSGDATSTNRLANIKAEPTFLIIEANESAVLTKTPQILRR